MQNLPPESQTLQDVGILFAVVVSLGSVSREAVIGSTAAYAAIMVVYIGSSEGVGG